MGFFFNKNPDLSHLPGDMGLPYFGYAFEFLRDALGIIERHKTNYGEIYKSRFFGTEGITLLGKAANKFVLVEQAHLFSNQKGWENIIEELFPNGLMLMDGERHQHHRSILNAAFKKPPMQGYLEIMNPIIEDFFAKIPTTHQQIKLYYHFKALTLQIAGKVFFGLDFSGDLQYINDAIIHVLKASMAIPINLPFTDYGKGIKGRKKLENYFYSIIAEKRANPQKDLFSVLCTAQNEEGKYLSDGEIIDHLIFILMAGHDTTASAISSLSYLLAKHPAWQQKLREEAEQFREQQEGEIQLQDLRKLELMGFAIKESLRLFPPVLMVPRVSTQPFEYDGHIIPANTTVTVVLQHHHTNQEIWDNPREFDPMRFSNDRKEHQRCPYTYLPFGAGKHYCLGFSFAEMEIKLILLHLLKKMQWTVGEGYQMKINQVPIQEPVDGLPVEVSIME